MPKKLYPLFTAFLIAMLTSLLIVVPPIEAMSSDDKTDNGSSVQTVLSANDVSIDFDGKTIFRDNRPLIINDRLWVPLRTVSIALGCEVLWEEDTHLVELSGKSRNGDDFTLALKPGSSQVTGNLSNQIMQAANNALQNAVPIVVEGRTMVPIRFLAGIMNLTVNWDPVSRTVYLHQAEGDDANQAGEDSIKVLSEIDNGETITMHTGDIIRIELDSNPSTGFTWVVNEEPDSSVSVLIGPDFVADSSGTGNIMGAGGQECWQIKAVGPGNTTLSLWYMRPWESVQPLHTFQLMIKVL